MTANIAPVAELPGADGEAAPRRLARTVWDLLTRPATGIVQAEARRRARTLSALLLATSALLLTGILVNPSVPVIIGNGAAIAAYLLSRTRRYVIATIIAVVGLQAASFQALIMDPQALTSAYVYAGLIWAVLPIVLGSVWLPPRGAILLTFLNLAAMVVSALVRPDMPIGPLMNLGGFMIGVGGLLSLAAYLRERDLQQIQQQSVQLQEHASSLLVANRELALRRQQAEEANRLKTQFLSTMSHELRTPLNAINGFAQIMLAGMTGEMNPKQRDNMERIVANGQHLLTMVNDILDLAKIEAGHIKLIERPFVVLAWMDAVIGKTRSLADEKGLTLHASLDPALPASLVGDEGRLSQIALNLLANAIKFTEQGEVTLEVRRHDDFAWTLIVSDTGIGIPPHALEFIFDEFRQVDGSTTRQHGGTGLGLSIVRNLARLMGGGVKATSKVGEGSTFTVLLPMTLVEQALKEEVTG